MQYTHERNDLEDLIGKAFRYAFTLTKDRESAEDLVQEALTKLMEKNKKYKNSYLYTTIRNLFIDNYRRSKIVKMEKLEYTEYKIKSEDNFILEPILEKAMNSLKNSEREILYLFVVENFTAKELSELTGKPIGTILSTVHRAKRKLKIYIDDTKNLERLRKMEQS